MALAKTAALQKTDSAHYLHPFTDHADLAKTGARIIERAEGVYVWDTEGHKILDGMSGLWCVNMGYGQQSLVDAASKQMTILPFYNSFFNTAVEPAIELAKLLSEITPPQFNHVFYSSSGSESNDTILRMVRRYWDILGETQRKTIISRKNAYHGSTVAGASLGGMTGMHEQGDLPIPGIVHIEQPYFREVSRDKPELAKLSEDEFGVVAAGWLEEKILEVGADKVAAFIGVPVQGAGGVIVPPSTYWPEIQRICDKYGVLLISDEVICGFGRLGTWFGCETMGTQPDFMTMAKGITSGYLPLGGAMVSDRVVEVLYRDGDFNHGYTYSGHPVAAAAGLATLEIYRKENLLSRAADLAGYWEEAAHSLKGCKHVKDVRNYGLVAGIELESMPDAPGKRAYEVFVRCFEKGALIRVTGDIIALSPPLIIERSQIDDLFTLLQDVLQAQD